MTEKLPDIVKTVTLNAPIDKVWASVTEAKNIGAWFMPNDFKPVVGHEFTIQSPFGPSPCKVEEVDAPYFVKFIWDTDGWFVSFSLKEMGDQTEFTLTHGGWKEASSIVPKAKLPANDVRNNMDGGWTMLVGKKLKEFVEA